MWWIVAGCTVLLLLLILVLILRARAGGISAIVLFRQTPRRLTEVDVRGAARRALGPDAQVVPVDTAEKPEMQGAFGIAIKNAPFFLVYSIARPYVDDPKAESARYEDPRARQAFADHTAWVSIDLSRALKGQLQRSAIPPLCRLAAELLDEGTTLLYATWLSRVALPSPQVEAALKSDKPLEPFGDDELNTPIIHAQGDARIEAAVAEARRRWPEFVAIHARVGAAGEPLVKGRFTTPDGGDEHMWLGVKSISDQGVAGELLNQPAHIPTLHKGQSVSIPHEDISDWAILDGDTPVGMFVERLLQR